MKKTLQVLTLSAIGCMGMSGLYARPVVLVSSQTACLSSSQRLYEYKIYQDNGKYVGRCTVSSPAELEVVAGKLGKGTYLFVGVSSTLAPADRRIIVYFGGSTTASATADRRIIVY
jgi:hypothetical protein